MASDLKQQTLDKLAKEKCGDKWTWKTMFKGWSFDRTEVKRAVDIALAGARQQAKKEAELLRSNNCPKCGQRIFITSAGFAECSEGCENYLKPLGYIDKEIARKRLLGEGEGK